MTTATSYIIDASPFARNGNLSPNNMEAIKAHLQQRISSSLSEVGQSGAALIVLQDKASLSLPLSSKQSLVIQSMQKINVTSQLFYENEKLPIQVLKSGVSTAILALQNKLETQQTAQIVLYLTSPLEGPFQVTYPPEYTIKVYNIGSPEIVQNNRAILQQIFKNNLQIADFTSGNIYEAGVQTEAPYEDDPELQQALMMSQIEEIERQQRLKQQGQGQGGPAAGQDFGDLL